MTKVRTATFTNVLTKKEQTVEFPDITSAMQFVYSLQVAGVKAIVNLEAEDLVAWYINSPGHDYKLTTTH